MSSKKNRKATTEVAKAKRTRAAKVAQPEAPHAEVMTPEPAPATTVAAEAPPEILQATAPPEPEPAGAPQAAADEAVPTDPPEPTEVGAIPVGAPATDGATVEQPGGEPGPAEAAAPQPLAVQPPMVPAQPKRVRKAKKPTGDGEGKKLSALDAAAKVLGEEGRAMTCKELIETMAAKGYWASPGGKTPEATLYSAILRELQTRGDQARFVKADRGKFALRTAG
jgi:hypothetical protein